jgi:predicted  nucleic acid-binding Zn-ribbon protein
MNKRELQDRNDAIDKLPEAEVRIILKETYNTLDTLAAHWEEREAELKKENKKLLERYESLEGKIADYKDKLRSFFEL